MFEKIVIPKTVAETLVAKVFENRPINTGVIIANINGVTKAIGIINNSLIMIIADFKEADFTKVGFLDGVNVYTVKL